VLRYDPDARVVIVQHCDTETGKISRQFPSEEAVRDIKANAQTSEPAPASETAPAGEGVSITV
jgi:hypothetical protein